MRRARHPNIVNLERVCEGDDHVHLVMDLIEGEVLLDLIIRLQFIPETLCRKIAYQICKAIQHLNTKGIAHRNIKLENVILGHDGVVKLIDFGLAVDGTNGFPEG